MKTVKYLDYDANRTGLYGHTLSMNTNIRVTDGKSGKDLFIPFSFFATQPVVTETTRGGKITDLKISDKAEISREDLLKALIDEKLTDRKYQKVLKSAVSNIYIEVTFSDLKVIGARLDLKGLVKNIHADWREGEKDYEENKAAEAVMFKNILLIYLGQKGIAQGKVTMFPSGKK